MSAIDFQILKATKCVCRENICGHCGEYKLEIMHAIVTDITNSNGYREMVGCRKCICSKNGMIVKCRELDDPFGYTHLMPKNRIEKYAAL